MVRERHATAGAAHSGALPVFFLLVGVIVLLANVPAAPVAAQGKAKSGKPAAVTPVAPIVTAPATPAERLAEGDKDPAQEKPPVAEAPAATVTPGAGALPPETPTEAAKQASSDLQLPEPVVKSVELPKVSTPEAAYIARLDDLIAPVRDWVPPAEDGQRLKEAIRLLGAGDPAGSRARRNQITDPAGRRLVEWLALKAGFGEPPEFQAFLAANPHWPDRQLLGRRAEEQLFVSGGSAQKIRAFFKDGEPKTGEPKTGAGWAALASAYLAEKDEAKARAAAVKTWREFELAASLEAGFLERFGSMLAEADHRWRLDRILVDEVRTSAERTDRAAIARRILPLLSAPERKKAEARIAIFLRAKLAGQLLAALPPDAEGQAVDWGLAYQKVQHYRRLLQHEDAWKILKAAPADPALIVSPDDWWAERRSAAFDALRAGKAELAYELVRDPGPLSAAVLKDQSFLAGWIALRHLVKADVAIKHFEVSRTSADGPLSQSRADYWAGRAYEAAGDAKNAEARYAGAARQIDTFHGQLGRQKLASGVAVDIRPALPALATAEEARRFNALDAVRAIVIVAKLGLDRNILRALFGGLRNTLATEAEMAMLAHLAQALGDTQASLRVGKTAIARGMNLIMYAYPLHAFPAYAPLRDPPEPGILLGIARQETEFNTAIVSSAGARGLLQVMPGTAQSICREHKIKCDLPRLLTDSGYNAMIGSAYVGDRLVQFRGNYVLMLAAYNAGPGRAQQWMRDFGDPRDAAVDPIDWIERIPLEETREYVKKVLSNVQVYRARLGEEMALRLVQDLTRTIGGRRTQGTAPEVGTAKE